MPDFIQIGSRTVCKSLSIKRQTATLYYVLFPNPSISVCLFAWQDPVSVLEPAVSYLDLADMEIECIDLNF